MALSDNRNHPGRRIWSARAPLDPTLRRQMYGPIRPMDEPGFLRRLFGQN